MRKRGAEELKGKTIDIHSHVGVSLKAYVKAEYPYAETVESLYHKQLSGAVDVNVVFPFSPDLHCDLRRLVETGDFVPASAPFSPVPYQKENELLLREVYEFCPELSERFLPFLCFDPGRQRAEQLEKIKGLMERYPVYGFKILPPLCQSRAIDLLQFPELFEFAAAHNLPMLFHATSDPSEGYSYAGDILRLVDAFPKVRYCLAHCLLFHRPLLEEAARCPNVWVDSAALKIQVDVFRSGLVPTPPESRFPADYSDHRKVLGALATSYPDTMIWGSDAPAYAYIVDRKNGDGSVTRFRLKGTYADEVAALNYLPPEQKQRLAGVNPLNFLFGK